MEENNSTGIAVFHQICEVNDLDPQAILQETQEQNTTGQSNNPDAALLIRTAYERRVKNLLAGIAVTPTGKEYTIDPDPAAPAFMLHEAYIRDKYSESEATSMIEALGLVQLPVTG